MTYDLHFECGRKEKHNNWVMHTLAMMLFYELGIWNKDQLEIELTKSSMAMNEAIKPKKRERADNNEEPVRAIISVERVPIELLDEIKGHVFRDKDDDDTESAEAWIAKVSFSDEPSEERIEQFKQNAESTMVHAIKQAKRTDYFIAECEGTPYGGLFTRLLKNDGEEIKALEAAFLMTKFMSVEDAVHKMANEYMPVNIPSLVGHFAYSVGSGYSFRVY